ncbi:MAG TPA: helix-turn-helix domain-containing protein [Actinomycetota bacterium]|jgi:predicted ArsR family transcriptional regulator
MPTREPSPIEIHKALADDTRFRLYRYLGLSGRPVSVRELSTRLSLHPNTLRPHLRRLEEARLVRREARKGAASVGRPQTLYTAVDRDGHEGRDYRLLAEILAGLVTGARTRERAAALAREWGQYLAFQGGPKPGTRLPAGRNLAVLQEAMAAAGFEPRFRRAGRGVVEVSLRDCPFRDLLDDHRELVCAIHRGLIEGMLGALKPPLALGSFEPFAERSVCRLVARSNDA